MKPQRCEVVIPGTLTWHAYGRPEEALGAYGRAVEVREELRRTLEPEGRWTAPLASRWALARWNRGRLLRRMREHESAEEDLAAAVGIWRPMVEAGARREEGHLAGAWMELAGLLVDRGWLAEAEDELFRAVDLLPHRAELLEEGVALYHRMLGMSDSRLEAGKLPRDEVEQGLSDLLAQLVPFQGGGWRTELLRARREHGAGRHDRALAILSELGREWGRLRPEISLERAQILLELQRWTDAVEAGEYAARVAGRYLAEEAGRRNPEKPGRTVELGNGEIRGFADLVLDGVVVTMQAVAGAVASRPGASADRLGEAARRLRPHLETVRSWNLVLDAAGRNRLHDVGEGLEALDVGAWRALRFERDAVRRVASIPLGVFWEERIAPQIERLAAALAAGQMDDDEAGASLGGLLLDIRRESRALGPAEEWYRNSLERMLGIDPLSDPALLPLPTALAAADLARDSGNSGWILVAVAGMGTAAEGVLRSRLFDPYLRAVKEGGRRRARCSRQWMAGP